MISGHNGVGGDATQPVLSVLMPSLNSAPYIGDAIKSVLALDGPPIELVIQDGGSTDGTDEVVAGVDDPRVKFVTERDDGQSDALNRALARANGEWIGWLNADDVYRPEGVAGVTRLFRDEVDFLYGDHAVTDAAGTEMKRYHSSRQFTARELLRRGAFINCMAGFYRASLLRDIGGWRRDLHLCMDYELLLRLARSDARTRYVPESVMALRVHEGGKTQRDSWGIAREGWQSVTPHLHGVRGGRTLALYGQLRFRAYLLTKALWGTPLWRQMKPAKRL